MLHTKLLKNSEDMTIQRILLFLILGFISACSQNPSIENANPSTEEHLVKNSPLKQIKLKAYLNKQGNVELELQNTAAQQAYDIVIGFRFRYSARIVSNMTYDVAPSIKPGQTIIVDTELPLPTQRSIIRAEVIKATFTY